MSVGPVRVMESGVVLKPNVKEVSSQCMWTESASSSGTTSCVMLCLTLTVLLWELIHSVYGTALLKSLITGLVFVCTLPAM